VLHAVSFTRAFHHYHCYTRIPLHRFHYTRIQRSRLDTCEDRLWDRRGLYVT